MSNSKTAPKKPSAPTEQYEGLLPQPNDLLPKFVGCSLVLHVVTILLLGFFAVVLYRLAVRPAPSLVQLASGQPLTVTATRSTYRDPNLIKDFVGKTAATLYSWSGKVNGDPDPGIVLDQDEELRVTTPTWEVAFSLSEADGYRTSFLKQLARFQQKLPIRIWEGHGNTFLKISHIRDPQELKPGHWKVDLIAYLLLFDQGKLVGQAIPFNKTFYLRAIDQPPLLLDEQATPIQKAIWNSRSAQLEIENITDFEEED